MAKLKQLNIWGEWEETSDVCDVPVAKKSKKEIYEDYDAFVLKFDKDAPKTTDDCYTPQPVYEAVLNWLRSKVNITGRPVVRPFYPGGDYINFEYPDNCVVVDNPPFSIVTQIVRFYLFNKIDYFLFAPGLSLFSPNLEGNCDVIIKSSLVYDNKAVIATGFKSNLFPGVKILLAASLEDAIKEVGKKKETPTIYPPQVVSSALLRKYVIGDDLEIKDNECYYTRTLDALKPKSIFGNAYIIASHISDELQQRYPTSTHTPTISLSERELKILQKLDEEYDCNQEKNKTSRQNKT